MECFAVWFDFMFLHVFYKAAVCVSVMEKEKIYHAFGAITPHKNREILHSNKCKLCTTLKDVFLPADMVLLLCSNFVSDLEEKLGQRCSADSRVPPKVFHQRRVFWHLFDVLPVFICQNEGKTGLRDVTHSLPSRTDYLGCRDLDYSVF